MVKVGGGSYKKKWGTIKDGVVSILWASSREERGVSGIGAMGLDWMVGSIWRKNITWWHKGDEALDWMVGPLGQPNVQRKLKFIKDHMFTRKSLCKKETQIH